MADIEQRAGKLPAATPERAAYHEAGHMAAAVAFGLRHVVSVSIRPDAESYGRCKIHIPDDMEVSQAVALNHIKALFCGDLGEAVVAGEGWPREVAAHVMRILFVEKRQPADSCDLSRVARVAGAIGLTDEEIAGLEKEAVALFRDEGFLRGVHALAQALLREQELTFDRAEAIVAKTRLGEFTQD